MVFFRISLQLKLQSVEREADELLNIYINHALAHTPKSETVNKATTFYREQTGVIDGLLPNRKHSSIQAFNLKQLSPKKLKAVFVRKTLNTRNNTYCYPNARR